MKSHPCSSDLTNFECLSRRSYAYREYKSTSTCLNDLLLHITLENQEKLDASAISFDIQNAYRKIELNQLKCCFESHAISTGISSWILNFLYERTLKVGNYRTLIKNGSKAAAVSPVLFNAFISSLHAIVDASTVIF